MRLSAWTCTGLVGLSALASAQEPTVAIRGFGGGGYGNTGSNSYLIGTPGGNLENAQLALNLTATPKPKLRVIGQLHFEHEGADLEINLDYALAEWRFSDRARLRLGRVGQPFGISTETFDVGTNRPFFSLPQSVYGSVGIVSESYDGAGLTGFWRGTKGWGLEYDAYVGEVSVTSEEAVEAPAGLEPLTERIREMFGGRIKVLAPTPGLSFGASAYSGTRDGGGRHTSYGAQAAYSGHGWLIRGEMARHDEADEPQVTGAYVEVAYQLNEQWQVAGRYDRSRRSAEDGLELPASLFRHRDWALGLNYWFGPDLVIKASYHNVNGNRFARGEPGAVAADPSTSLFLLGAQFSF